MLQFIGSIFILVACTCMGISKEREMRYHLEELEEVKKMFYLLRSEFQYTRAPFAEVFEKIGGKTKAPFGTWLLCLSRRLEQKERGFFWQIWHESISEDLTGCCLQEKELEELKNVGKNLEYMESLNLYIEQMEYHIKETREAYQSKKKLCRSMGIMGGIFLVILLL